MATRGINPALLAVILGGCAMGQDYVRPQLDVPQKFHYAMAASATPAQAARWWERFDDPVLTEYIRAALEYNFDLRAAAARVLEYRAMYVAAGAPLWPQISFVTTETRTRQGQNPISDVYQGGLALGYSLPWELDFWGRIRRLSEGAYADLAGQEQARQAIRLTLISSVATSYIQLRTFDSQLEIARRTRDSRGETRRLAKLGFDVGVISEVELKQAEVEYKGTVASVEQLEEAVAQKENELSLLLGRNPGEIRRGLAVDRLAVPAVPAGLPSELLTRRPDVLQAEQALVGANARVGAAKAALFPTISLTGTYGGVSPQLSNLFSGPNRFWSFVPTVNAPIFNGGSLQAQLAGAKAQREEALAGYLKAVQSAFGDAENALVAVAKTGEQKVTQAQLVADARRYVYLAKLRYDNGVTSNLEVLDSQRSLFSAEQNLAQAQSDALVAAVNLYTALGGDWGAEADGKTQVGDSSN